VRTKFFFGKPQRTRSFRTPGCRWNENVEMNLREMGSGCGDWTELTQDRDQFGVL
jgi:hypothetical protein